jgi:hypothetical protein
MKRGGAGNEMKIMAALKMAAWRLMKAMAKTAHKKHHQIGVMKMTAASKANGHQASNNNGGVSAAAISIK